MSVNYCRVYIVFTSIAYSAFMNKTIVYIELNIDFIKLIW